MEIEYNFVIINAISKNLLKINKCCDYIKKFKTLFTNKNLDAQCLTILSHIADNIVLFWLHNQVNLS